MGLPLECFDLLRVDPVRDDGPSADYLAGLAQGRENAIREFDADQTVLRSDLLSAIGDLGFGYAEARRHLLRSLEPLLSQIAMTVVPTLLREGMAIELAQHLTNLAQDAANTPIKLVVNSANAGRLRPLLADIPGPPIIPDIDDSLGDGDAYWATPQAECALDLDSMVTGIRDALAAVIDDTYKGVQNG